MKIEHIFGNIPVLNTERTILRKLKSEDIYDMYNYCSDEVVSEYTTLYTKNQHQDIKMYSIIKEK